MTFMNDAEGWHDECRAIPTDRYSQGIYFLLTFPGQKSSWAELSFVPWEDLQSCQQLLLPYSIKRLFWYTDCDHSRKPVSEESQRGREKAEWLRITCSPWPGPVCFVFGISSFPASSAIPITNVVSLKGGISSPLPGYPSFKTKDEI